MEAAGNQSVIGALTEEKKNSNCITTAAKKFYASILYPKVFLTFNILCIIQTVPALYYYISFFQKDFYLVNSTGMAPVWGCTIGAVAAAIVTSALLPIPPNAITKAFCIAVILWEFLVSFSLLIACVCLAIFKDFHGFAWSLLGSIVTFSAGNFLLWMGLRVSRRSENGHQYGVDNDAVIGREDKGNDISMNDFPFSLSSVASRSSSFCKYDQPPSISSIEVVQRRTHKSASGTKTSACDLKGGNDIDRRLRPSESEYLRSDDIVIIEIGAELDDHPNATETFDCKDQHEEKALETNQNIQKLNASVPDRIPVKDWIPNPAIKAGKKDTFNKLEAVHNDEKKSDTATLSPACRAIKFILIQVVLWTILFVFAVIPSGFAVQQVFQAMEFKRYPSDGTFHMIPTYEGSITSTEMRIYCMGDSGIGRPMILLEPDSATSGFALYNIQNILSASWRVCTYDRGGYGWSQVPPLGSVKPMSVVYRLNYLLTVAGEGQSSEGIILIGAGTGGQIMQTYAYNYPSQVAGLSLLDSYPEINRLQGRTTSAIHKSTVTICGDLQISRALETVAVIRAVTDQSRRSIALQNNKFIPTNQLSKYESTQTTGRYWAAQYNDLCVNAGSLTAYTDYLDSVSANQSSSALSQNNAVTWPVIPGGKPVLIVSAGNTIDNDDPDSLMYKRQAVLYNETLSPGKSKWTVCPRCDHSLAYDHDSTVVAGYIDKYFSGYY